MRERILGVLCLAATLLACEPSVRRVDVGWGWARNSVNTPVFRKNALYTHLGYQYIGYYDADGVLVIGKRASGSRDWELKKTRYQGNTKDAHNAISLIVDGDGYIHVSWDHHNSKLRYIRSTAPEVLDFSDEIPMIDREEEVVSYPEFYTMAGGDLLFMYRDGGSGHGDLIINKYSLVTAQWTRLQDNLISGEGERNAYWQACVGDGGVVHLSWVWRESSDVASNHDMSYAKSTDGGLTWQKSNGDTYTLPITAATAEVVKYIPQHSDLINQTSMATDEDGRPMIVSYWKNQGDSVPQYQFITQREDRWVCRDLGFRTVPFSLSGIGTKAIPIARPQIVAANDRALVIFRDVERGNKVTVAMSFAPDYEAWELRDLTTEGFAAWEPTLDPSLWSHKAELNLFLQDVTQVDGEGIAETEATQVQVLEWKL
ncbi:neuraminidase [Reichenbachiella sp. 5M10]|uniref:BNR repeat-containing protein n=1 Tax=Reichenbachiella sp. 5M10 TaxID=1889772 RepID=UPI000C15A9C7|nr:BNR repeat-containing protein [Reichenbachiella sp. 5M10]PIB35720.1 neuraminidase [Reichenbachiella sp. 5M10]